MYIQTATEARQFLLANANGNIQSRVILEYIGEATEPIVCQNEVERAVFALVAETLRMAEVSVPYEAPAASVSDDVTQYFKDRRAVIGYVALDLLAQQLKWRRRV